MRFEIVSNACGCGVGRRQFLRLFAGASAGAAVAMLGSTGLLAADDRKYEAMLFSCIDPRMVEPLHLYMQNRGLKNEYSHIALAGSAISVVAPAFAEWRPAFWENLNTSIKLHKIQKIIAINHRDCGAAKIAYGAEAVSNRAAETATHRKVLTEFRQEVHQAHPNLGIETGLMDLDGTLDQFS